VLIRPHPGNIAGWQDADLADLGPVAIAPRARPNIPMSEEDEALYHHSLHHAAAVVGVNTSAMVEAAIVGKPVHTLRAPEFADTQDGTLHFRMLLDPAAPGVRVADTLEEHFAQLAEAIARPDAQRQRAERFVHSFVRPHGLDRAATPIFADAVEDLARTSRLAGLRAFLHPVDRRKLRAVVAKRRRGVAEHVVRAAWRPRARLEAGVRDIYEDHYNSDNRAYAASRDKRRDVFRLNGSVVYADGWFTIRSHSDVLVETLDRLGARSVLEVGSGRGTNLALLAMRRPALELTGVELTEAGVEQSRRLVDDVPAEHVRAAGLRNIDPDVRGALGRVAFERANALELPFPDSSFDAAFTVLVLEQIAGQWPAVVSEMRRVSRSWCIFLEPFGDVNGLMGKAYLRSLDYFRAHHAEFAAHGLEPVRFTTRIPQKLHFRTGLLVTRVVKPGPR
jgi:SAM-dependent methyltransferase